MSNNIRFYRERAGLTLEAATVAAGWPSRSTWQGYESSRRTPNIERIKTILEVLSGGRNGKVTFERVWGEIK